MRNLILLNETVSKCMQLALTCNKVSLHGEDAIDPSTEVAYRELLIDSLVGVMAVSELIGQEYEVDKDNLFPIFESKLKELQESLEDQPNSSSHSSDGDL